MATKNFNAKKVHMGMLAAVVFSFVFTTSANASSSNNTHQTTCGVRV